MPPDKLTCIDDGVLTKWDIIFTLCQLLGIPFVILIVYLLIRLWPRNNERFGNTYYSLIKMDLSMNLIVYGNTWLGNRMKKFLFFTGFLNWLENLCPGFLTGSNFLFNVFLPAQLISSIIQNLYRSIFFKWESVEKNKWWWKMCYCVLGIFLGIYYYFLLHKWGYTSETFTFNNMLCTITHMDTVLTYALITAAESTFFLIAYLVTWVAFGIELWSKVESSQLSSNSRKIIRHYTITALCNASSYLPIMAWSIACLILGENFDEKLRLDLLIIASDIKTFSTAITLLLADQNVKDLIYFKKPSTASTNNQRRTLAINNIAFRREIRVSEEYTEGIRVWEHLSEWIKLYRLNGALLSHQASCLVIIAWSLASYFMESTSWFDSKWRLDILMFCSDFRTFATPICMTFDMNVKRDFEAKRKYLKNLFKKQTPPENPVVPNTLTLF